MPKIFDLRAFACVLGRYFRMGGQLCHFAI